MFQWETDLEGNFRWVSEEVCSVTRLSSEQVLAKGSFGSLTPSQLRAAWTVLGCAPATEHAPIAGFLHALNDADHHPVWLSSSAVPFREPESGAVVGYRGNSRSCEELRQHDGLLEGLFREMVDPVVIVEIIRGPVGCSDSYLVLKVNPAFERMTGQCGVSLEGRTIEEIFPRLDSSWIERCAQAEVSGKPVRFDIFAPSYQRLLEVTSFSPAPCRVACILVDITEKNQLISKLRESEERLQLAIRGINEGIWDWDLRDNSLYLSPTWKRMIGFEDHELPNDYETFETRLHPEDRPSVLQSIEDYLQRRIEGYSVEFRFLHKDRSWRWILARGEALFDGEGRPYRMAGSHCDITERKENELRLTLFSKIFDHSQDALMVTDARNHIVEVNPAFTRITGYELDEVVGRDPKFLSSGKQPASFYQKLWTSLQRDRHWSGEVWNRRKCGEFYAELLTISAVYDRSDQLRFYLAVFSDITRQKQHREELDRVTNYDVLTGLPNRHLLADRMKCTIEKSLASGSKAAVCCLDLDDFQPLNASLGYSLGDQVLLNVSQRVGQALRKSDTLARVGGDDFVIVLGELEGTEEANEVLGRVLLQLARPMKVEDQTVSLTASVGVTMFPQDRVEPDTLLRHADHALFEAKNLGKNRVVFFDSEKERQRAVRGHALQEMECALYNNEYVLYFQPKVNLRNGRVVGAEALIRWRHPQRGLLAPGAFLDHLYNSTLEIPVGEWVASAAINQLAEWRSQGLELVMSINVSPLQLLREDFLPTLERQLAAHPQVKPVDLELEILESTAISELSRAASVIAAGRSRGFRFSLDDFGTGYSSLAHFRQLPVDILKIDRAFVQNMDESPEDYEIVDSVVRLARAFNRHVIAEGVETEEQGRLLLELGCELGQGYGLGRPMPIEEFQGWFESWTQQNPWMTSAP